MVQLSEKTLGDYLEYWAKETPDKEYIVYSDRDLRFTWSQFNSRVDDMARGLVAIGVTKGTHVGLWAQNVPDWLNGSSALSFESQNATDMITATLPSSDG